MKTIPWRVQIGAVVIGYALVLLASAAMVFARYLVYLNNPNDVVAAGGMYAFGDWMLELIIVAMLLVPTFLLALILRNKEAAYTRYSQAALGLSLTAPMCMGLFFIPAVSQGNSSLGWFCMYRVLASPLAVLGLAGSRLLARFKRAKRLTSYALLIEIGALGLMLAAMIL
jgi:hypothetical protein